MITKRALQISAARAGWERIRLQMYALHGISTPGADFTVEVRDSSVLAPPGAYAAIMAQRPVRR